MEIEARIAARTHIETDPVTGLILERLGSLVADGGRGRLGGQRRGEESDE